MDARKFDDVNERYFVLSDMCENASMLLLLVYFFFRLFTMCRLGDIQLHLHLTCIW